MVVINLGQIPFVSHFGLVIREYLIFLRNNSTDIYSKNYKSEVIVLSEEQVSDSFILYWSAI